MLQITCAAARCLPCSTEGRMLPSLLACLNGFHFLQVPSRKTKVGERLVRSFSHQTRDRKELATKQFVLPKLKISESTKVFLGSF